MPQFRLIALLIFSLPSFSYAQVGIGTLTPSSKLEVIGAGTTSATTALKVGSASNTILTVKNDGLVEISTTKQGFLPPRMTAAQRNAIPSPPQGLTLYCIDCGPNGEFQVYNGSQWTNSLGGAASAVACGTITSTVSFTYRGSSVTYETVVGANNRCWLKRNLGATQVATSSTDANSYGDLFQWGRGDDGHQIRTSTITTTLSSSDHPSHGDFIIASTDWRNPKNDNLWQGVSGINNPCPTGFRLPTEAEWTTEQTSWSTLNSAGAFASPLKLPVAGYRDNDTNGTLKDVGTWGVYWSSTVNGTSTRRINFGSSSTSWGDGTRSRGASVRCIKN